MRLTLRNVWTLESRGYLGPGYTWDQGIPGSGYTKDPSNRTTRVLLGARLALALIRHALLCLLCNSLLCCDMRCVACCGRFAWPVPENRPGYVANPVSLRSLVFLRNVVYHLALEGSLGSFSDARFLCREGVATQTFRSKSVAGPNHSTVDSTRW